MPPSRPADEGPPVPPARPLDPTGAELRELLALTSEFVARTVDGFADAPASDLDDLPRRVADPELRRLPGESGRPLAELLDVLERAAAPGLNPATPGYFAFIPGSGLLAAAMADLLAGALNRYTGLAFPAPGLVALEADLLRWLADLFALPPGAAGLLGSGASLSTLSALIAARTALVPADAHRDAVLYTSVQAHHATARAMSLLGFPPESVRAVPVDARLRMDVVALRAALAADRAAGRRPFCVAATAGTTDTGAIDPLPALADVAADEGLWFHVDAAYGGFFQLTARGRDRLAGVERADSLVLDPHKGLFLPFGTGCLLVRDGGLLRRAHAGEHGAYLQDLDAGDLPDFAGYGPELTRPFRGLRLWLPLHLHGVAAFRDALDERLDLAVLAYERLAADDRFVVPLRPELSTVVFRCRAPGGNAAAEDAATAELLRRVNAERRAFLSSTRIHGRYTARLTVLNHRTDRARVEETLDALARHADGVT